MKISDVKITPVKQRGGHIAFAALVLDDSFYISGIAVHEKRDGSGYRLTYPTRKSGEQIFNLCHPISQQTSKAIENAIFQKLKDVMNKDCNNAGHNRYQFTT